MFDLMTISREITIYHYLLLGVVLFVIGIAGSIFTRNVIKMLISIEIMLTGVNINFVTFSSFCGGESFDGYIMALFYTGLGAAELAVALYIFYLMYKNKKSDNIEKYSDL